MGNPKQKWTAEEEEALRAGVAKHGTGKWKNIQKDPEFNPFLFSRSNIDLKDKWRNMSVSAGEKSRTPKPKANSDIPPATKAVSPIPVSNLQSSASVITTSPLDEADPMVDDSTKTFGDAKTAPKYNAMIFEAISALNKQHGADTTAIVSYIEQRQVVPQNFRRQLSSRLRRLVAQEKLEKVQNCFKIKNNSSLETKTPTPKQKDVRPRHLQSTSCINSGDTMEEAAVAAAYRIAEAENKSFVAAEAVKEAERVSKMAEDTDSLLQLAKEIFEKCSRGEVVLIA
ncbi:telomere repeat-binding factor 4 [Ricinus communis]|uniref:MYB transcription factor n=1 Tax=Ricinus communis TaxID=3988 RepID=B9RK91_RICCO|nr:telomere repeat-binding factor 4 [Ricinus communis]EEF48089.1 DNA binding protein, putative [Ricinus communis]|eukprot:XP_002514135.1 telomere repeat-binding factor 4 [Ricinus communis]